ncbi:terminase family protein, partial [Fibrobacter sp.]
MTPQIEQLARTNLLAFVKATMPNYSIGWVHREICARLMRFYTDVMERKSPRLILTMPPRHGKSQLVSKHFPAWCFGVNPDISFMACSYSDGLSRRVNKDVQRIMESNEYHRIFPRTTLPPRGSKYTRSTNLIEIPNRKGSFRSTGIGGSITGMGCEILGIDDPLKDRQEANSITIRDRIWDWYTSTAYTRLSPGGGVLVTLTRWHEDDLAGRLLNAMKQGDGDQWTVINYPAIAEKDEPHRKIGEALHPERYPLEMLEKIRINVGSYDWNALYQQHPAPVGGSIIKREWLQQYEILPKVF